MNSKNRLQEYCQKNKLEIPRYETNRTGGIDNKPEWASCVNIFNKTFNSNIMNNKTLAELDVANKILLFLDQQNKSNHVGNNQIKIAQKCDSIYNIDLEKYNNFILIDAENCDVNRDNLNVYSDTLFLFFCSKNTTKTYCFKLQQEYENCFVIISQSVGRDASDHLLTYIFGIICNEHHNLGKNDSRYYVLTKDHYGEYLEKYNDCTKFICNIDDIINEL
jgi:hypothetical protein